MRKIYILLLLMVGPASTEARQQSSYITVAAGQFDRRDTIVSFDLPANLRRRPYRLRDDSGAALSMQVDAQGRATFTLPELKSGATKRYRLEAASEAANRIEAISDGRVLHLKADGRPVFDFRLQPELPSGDIRPIFRRAGYMHPVYTPAGGMVTDDYPADHRHQHGIFFAWTKTEFEGRMPDFWNMGDGSGAVEFTGLDRTWSGAVHAGFKARSAGWLLQKLGSGNGLEGDKKMNIESLIKHARPGRKPQGIAAALLPFEASGEIAVEAFQKHLQTTHRAGLMNAVNMDTGYVNYLADAEKKHVLAWAREALGHGVPFVAGPTSKAPMEM